LGRVDASAACRSKWLRRIVWSFMVKQWVREVARKGLRKVLLKVVKSVVNDAGKRLETGERHQSYMCLGNRRVIEKLI
jgi:hypothetical protein